jgi:hypothetical protein
MSESPAARSAKRMKLAGETSYGKIPKEFLGNTEKMQFHIHDFANLKHKIGKRFYTNTINAHGHPWKLLIYPRGHDKSSTDAEYVSVFLCYAGENTGTNPVVAKAMIQTKTINMQISKFEFSIENKNYARGRYDYCKREDIIENDCNNAGTLTFMAELQVATEMKSVWFPQLLTCCNNTIGTQLYRSTETSDITFIVGASKKGFDVHKNIIAVRARDLYELVVTEEESSNDESDIKTIVLPDVDETAFEALLEFIYMDKVPTVNETTKSILLTANRFGCTDLKLYMESILIEKFLIPSTAASLLLLADSHSCALLKEAAMDVYASNPNDVMESSKDDWIKLKESNDLLVELLVYTNNAGGRKRYSSVVEDGNGTIDDADEFDVTSLRERLQKVGLDVDGSREYLLELWKNYVRANFV